MDRPIEEVFEALADMSVLDRWNPNVTASSRVEGDRFQVGSKYRSTIRRGPMRLTANSELTAIDPPHMVEYRGSISGFWSVDRLTFVPTRQGTRVEFFNESRPPAMLRPLSPLLNALFQRQARRAVRGAQDYLAN